MSEAVPQGLPMVETEPKICPDKMREYVVKQMLTNPNGRAFVDDPADADIYCRSDCSGPAKKVEERSALNPARYIWGKTYTKDVCADTLPADLRE